MIFATPAGRNCSKLAPRQLQACPKIAQEGPKTAQGPAREPRGGPTSPKIQQVPTEGFGSTALGPPGRPQGPPRPPRAPPAPGGTFLQHFGDQKKIEKKWKNFGLYFCVRDTQAVLQAYISV